MNNMLFVLSFFMTVSLSTWPVLAASAPPKVRTVKLSFIEALDPKDTTSSQRFQEEYEAAIKKGKELTAKSVGACGFELAPVVSFYGASDPIQAKEKGEQAAKDGAWMIVGPRRSNHYLLLAKGAPETPSVSLMASSEEVAALGDLHLSMVPSNSKMARAAAAESAARLAKAQNKSYLTVVSADCLTCKDFAKQFDASAASLGLVKAAEIAVIGDQPEMTAIKAEHQHRRCGLALERALCSRLRSWNLHRCLRRQQRWLGQHRRRRVHAELLAVARQSAATRAVPELRHRPDAGFAHL